MPGTAKTREGANMADDNKETGIANEAGGKDGEKSEGLDATLEVVKSCVDKLPPKMFPEGLSQKIAPQQAAKISLGLGILVEILWWMFTNSRAMALFDFVICFAGLYLGLYAIKGSELKKDNSILLASIGGVLCLETFFYGIYCWQALGVADAFRKAADEIDRIRF